MLCLSYVFQWWGYHYSSRTSQWCCVCLMCSSGEGITIHPWLLSDAVCLSYVFQWWGYHYSSRTSLWCCVCLVCSSGEGITIHPWLLSDAVCLSYVFQWWGYHYSSRTSLWCCVCLVCSSGEGITIHPVLLCDAVSVLCVPVVRVSLFIQNFSVMLCLSYVFQWWGYHYSSRTSQWCCVCLMCSSGEGITIHPELLSDAVSVLCVPVVRVSLLIQNFSVMLCLSCVFQWWGYHYSSRTSLWCCVSVLCVPVVRVSLFIQNFSVMLCLSYVF